MDLEENPDAIATLPESPIQQRIISLGSKTNRSSMVNQALQDLNTIPMRHHRLEIEAALRSMKTNFILLLIFFLNILLMFFLPQNKSAAIVGISLEIVMKFALPTITAISNFGPVKDMIKLYLQSMNSNPSIYDVTQ